MSVTMAARPQPQPYQSPDGRQRADTTFSVESASTSKSGKNKKDSLHDYHEEKRVISGKANPNAAMNEMQPVAAALEKPTIASLRSLSYNDQYGNPIVEPDRSNPTRPRWERPLDTIRSFEAAIEQEYRQKRSLTKYDAQSEAGFTSGYTSRRTSGYWGGGYDQARQRGSYYGNTLNPRDSYVDFNNSPNLRPGGLRHSQRQFSEASGLNHYAAGGRGPYQGGPVQQHSRDTMNTNPGSASGSGSEQWGSNTDPTSSENSSIDRVRSGPNPNDPYNVEYNNNNNGGVENGNQNMNSGYRGKAPIHEDRPYVQADYYNSQQAQQNGYYPQGHAAVQAPVPPRKEEPRKIISLSGSPSNGAAPPTPPPHMTGAGAVRPPLNTYDSGNGLKRKSWLRRRFSGRES